MNIMVINGSLGGAQGNTSRLIAHFCKAAEALEPTLLFDAWHLNEGSLPSRSDLEKANAFLFTSGTYWDSWGSPLQKFFEDLTPLEGDACWFGKPAAVLTTMHSVGGKEVLSRLQGVVNSFGLFVPPMSAMTFSFVNQVALDSGGAGSFEKDLWCVDDLTVLATNLVTAARLQISLKTQWVAWPVDRDDAKRIWVDDDAERTLI